MSDCYICGKDNRTTFSHKGTSYDYVVLYGASEKNTKVVCLECYEKVISTIDNAKVQFPNNKIIKIPIVRTVQFGNPNKLNDIEYITYNTTTHLYSFENNQLRRKVPKQIKIWDELLQNGND